MDASTCIIYCEMKPPRGKPRSIILLGFIIRIEIGIAIEIETI